MNAVFADTFFFLAILNPGDPFHERAVEMSRRVRDLRVTTAWVLTEVGDALARDNRMAFITLVGTLRAQPLVEIIPPSQKLFDAGLDLYAKRRDQVGRSPTASASR